MHRLELKDAIICYVAALIYYLHLVRPAKMLCLSLKDVNHCVFASPITSNMIESLGIG